MKYVVNWIPLRIRVRSRNTQPHLKVENKELYIVERISWVQFNSHLFLSPIGARTLEMPVPYPPPSVGAYTLYIEKFTQWSLSHTESRKCAEQFRILNKVGRGFIAHAWRCAQTDSSVLILALHLSLFNRTCVLGLWQDPAPHPKMVERRVVGGGIQDSRSIQPRIRKARLLITHVLDSCVKFLAVLHISSAQI